MTFESNIEIITEKDGSHHAKYLNNAYVNALYKSEDPITHTAAIIISSLKQKQLGNEYIQMGIEGWNHFPKGLNPTPEQIADRDWKYKHIIHAETSTIYKAAKKGFPLARTTMYMPWVPCTPCALAISDSGISTLIGHKQLIEKTPERWWESTEYALEILRKAGIELLMYDGKIDETNNLTHLFNGKIWHP